jgi:hypothetical protein
MAHDALRAHAHDELGISETLRARPIQAAVASAGSFAVGAAMPLFLTALAAGGAFDYPRIWQFAALPCALGCVSGARRRRQHDGRRTAPHVLGCPGHGDNRRRRGVVRNSRVSGRPNVPFRSRTLL